MARYILRRLGFIALTMLLASILIFAATQIIPGDIATMILGRFATEEAKSALREELGLNRSLIIQYLDWLWGFIRGDWGRSLSTDALVTEVVFERLRNSAILAACAFIIYVPLGIIFGLIAGLRRNSWVDNTLSVGSMAFIGLPEFVSGLILIYVFALQLSWLPAQSMVDYSLGFIPNIPMLVLPAITISLTSLAYILRMQRSSTIEVLEMDYVRTANLKGLSAGQVLFGHVLRNALLPTVTVVAIGIGWLVGGLIITETVFSYPGLGRMLLFAIQRRDLPLIQAVAMIIVIIVGLANLAADIIYAYLNPRIAYN